MRSTYRHSDPLLAKCMDPAYRSSMQCLRTFEVRDAFYAITFDHETDIAYLVSEDSLEKDIALLRFSPHCDVELINGRRIGRTRLSQDHAYWEFSFNHPGYNKLSVPNNHPDALFDLEEAISREFVLLSAIRPSLFQ